MYIAHRRLRRANARRTESGDNVRSVTKPCSCWRPPVSQCSEKRSTKDAQAHRLQHRLLDGFFSGPGGNVMAMPFDNGFSDYNAERLRAADTLLLGHKSYEGFRSYWPAIAEDVTQPAVEREISRLNAAIEKVVVSNSLKPDEVEGWGTTRVVQRADAHKEVAALKESPGREILIFGSHLLWNDLLGSGLVDELHFMIVAGVVGEGVRAFETKPPGSLRLLETRTFDGSSLLLARYAVER